jgi:hypothetical protein
MRANGEEGEGLGRFWQSRFKAVRILDEETLLACAAYVDLNPIRAALAETLETSDYTSVQRRIASLASDAKEDANTEEASGDSLSNHPRADEFLSPVAIDERNDPLGPRPSRSKKRCSDKGVLPLSNLDYLQLLDLTARMKRSDKRGYTPRDLPPLLERLGIDTERWRLLTKDFGRMFSQVAGKAQSVHDARSLKTKRRFYLKRFVQ